MSPDGDGRDDDDDDDALRPERDQTDEGLRTERKSTDKAIADRLEDIEGDALAHVANARKHADAAVVSARASADRAPLPASADRRQHRSEVAGERVIADAARESDRAAMDAAMRLEQAQQVKLLAALLPLEREKTDRYLLTERERADDALANRDDFMGMVSHDLRNLLSGIVLSANALADTAGGVERRSLVNIERIQRYAARMNRLIGDLVDVTSIDAGKLAVNPAPGDLAAMLDEAREAFGAVAAAKELTLVVEPAVGPLLGVFDHDRVFQVIANLVTNAIKFTAKGGRITMTGARSAVGLEIRVTDNGTGIAADQLESVFERFWQVGKVDSRGLGLGLYISHCIVAAHGGNIWTTSELGTGSTFYVTLPDERPPPT